jgi:hypothetical protein
MARQDGMRRPELIFLHPVSGDSRLVTFKSRWLSPKEVQVRLYRQTPLPSKRGSQTDLIYAVCDEIEQTGDATRTAKHRARLIAT